MCWSRLRGHSVEASESSGLRNVGIDLWHNIWARFVRVRCGNSRIIPWFWIGIPMAPVAEISLDCLEVHTQIGSLFWRYLRPGSD
jgi:hypothetical protein